MFISTFSLNSANHCAGLFFAKLNHDENDHRAYSVLVLTSVDLGVMVLSMKIRVLITFLVGLVVSLETMGSLGPSTAFAETFDCNRHTQGNSSFKTQSDFELWFPKEISLEIYDWKSREGYKSLTKIEKQIKYRLLPDAMISILVGYSDSLGKALVWQTVPSGYK